MALTPHLSLEMTDPGVRAFFLSMSRFPDITRWLGVVLFLCSPWADTGRAQSIALPPVLEDVSLVSVQKNSATLSTSINQFNFGSYPELTEWGFCYSIDRNLMVTVAVTYDDNHVPGVTYVALNSKPIPGSAKYPYSGSIPGLQAGTDYYVLAYAKNAASPNYSYSKTPLLIRTLSGVAPTVQTTASPSSITSSSAVLAGNVTSAGDTAVTSRGIEISTNSNLSVGLMTFTDLSGGLGLYSLTFGSLSANTLYYYRAFAASSVGRSVGSTLSFTTLPVAAPTPPSVQTGGSSSVTSSTFILAGNVTASGSAAVTERGIELSSTASFTSNVATGVFSVAGVGSYSVSFSGASANSTYYYRAYAVSTAGKAVGSVVSLVTPPAVPVVTTNPITASSATPTLVGVIQGGDSSAIISRGFQVGTNSDLKQFASFSSNTPLGTMAIVTNGLDAGLWHFYRAFATNTAGTGYGVVLAFKNGGSNSSSLAIVNASTRAFANTGASALITGIVLSGSGTATFVTRGIGPTLKVFGVAGAMVDPGINVVGAAGATVAANDNWETKMAPLFSYLGAFPLATGSRDAAALLSLPGGAYTIALAPTTGAPGISLAELYLVK